MSIISISIAPLILPVAAALLILPPTAAFVTPAARSMVSGCSRNSATSTPSSSSSSLDDAVVASSDEYTIGILGDLHIDPRKMDDYIIGRSHFLSIFDEAKSGEKQRGVALISLGDLGQPQNCEHNPDNDSELFAGTTACHELAAEYLAGFDGVPYEIVGGNHDLEGLHEFDTDEANLDMYLKAHRKGSPQFCREVARKTLLVGMGPTIFRNATYISHEVAIDREQISWFEHLLRTHPAEDGWKIFVFTHAPCIGSGLRILQENQVVDGCCWLNQNDDELRTKFIKLVRQHRCIKAWFSGHFHLGQDYQDSITLPTIDSVDDGPTFPSRGSCVFAQTSVMRSETSKDGRQQSRLMRGNQDGFEICTVDHQKGGQVRVDASITFEGENNELVGVHHAREEAEAYEHEKYFKIVKYHQPNNNARDENLHLLDGSFKRYNDYGIIKPFDIEMDTVAWWYMSCGRALGMHNGKLIEYDSSTLAPLGLVLDADELVDKKIGIIAPGLDAADTCKMLLDEMEDTMCVVNCIAALSSYWNERQAIVLIDKKGGLVNIVRPNEDGSYWRKFDRNAMKICASRVVPITLAN